MFIFFLKFTYGERAQCTSNARVTLKISGRITKGDYTIELISSYFKAASERNKTNCGRGLFTCHGLMLLWFTDLMNELKKLQFIVPKFRHSCLVPSSGVI